MAKVRPSKNVGVWQARIRGHRRWTRLGVMRLKPEHEWSPTPFLTPQAFVEIRFRVRRHG